MADTITVTSSSFDEGGRIPDTHAHSSTGGDNVSPDLRWSGAPDGTQSFAVTCWDPDAPTPVGFVHWVLFNIDAQTTSLPAGAGERGKNPQGSVLATTDWGEGQYGGMAPPPDDPPHHYRFTVYALDVPRLDLDETTTLAKFSFMSREHVLATGTITGRYGG